MEVKNEEVKNEFGIALKEARKEARKKLRETAEFTGLSISYLSDIEQGRKSPPDLETVRKLQDFLRVKGDKLLTIASKARTKMPTEVVQQIQNRPRLSELFFRAKNLTDEELEDLIDQASK
jgi:transcriptional regulator with XRE-family HTH domain